MWAVRHVPPPSSLNALPCRHADGVAVGDALCGTGLILLEANGTPHCLRTRLAAEAPPLTRPAAAGPGATAAAAAAGGRAAEGGGEGAAGTAATPAAAVERDVEAHIARIYGDLLAGGGVLCVPCSLRLVRLHGAAGCLLGPYLQVVLPCLPVSFFTDMPGLVAWCGIVPAGGIQGRNAPNGGLAGIMCKGCASRLPQNSNSAARHTPTMCASSQMWL